MQAIYVFLITIPLIAALVIVVNAVTWWIIHIVDSNNNKQSVNNRFWVTFKQFKRVFDKHKPEYIFSKRSGSFYNESRRHDIDNTLAKVNDNVFYFYTPIDYVAFRIYVAWYGKTLSRRSCNLNFTKFDSYDDNLL